MTLGINDTQHNFAPPLSWVKHLSIIMLNVIMLSVVCA